VKVILDTCVWTRFLRVQRDPADPVCDEVRRLVRRDAVAMLGAIRQELLSGAQPQPRFEQLKACLRFYPNLPQDEEDDENAATYYNSCRCHGVQGTATDLLICAVAVRHGLRIFTTDTDFEGFAKHLPITLHRARGATAC
jgi:predicted nucleic acid-binding protein